MQNLNAEDIKQTQNVQILRYLQNRRAITQAAAITVFGCSRLAAVIHRLKKTGLSNRDQDGKRFQKVDMRSTL